jgi:hypothetical protein
LRDRLSRYLSPPLVPVSLRELPCELELHDVPFGHVALPEMHVLTARRRSTTMWETKLATGRGSGKRLCDE